MPKYEQCNRCLSGELRPIRSRATQSGECQRRDLKCTKCGARGTEVVPASSVHRRPGARKTFEPKITS